MSLIATVIAMLKLCLTRGTHTADENDMVEDIFTLEIKLLFQNSISNTSQVIISQYRTCSILQNWLLKYRATCKLHAGK